VNELTLAALLAITVQAPTAAPAPAPAGQAARPRRPARAEVDALRDAVKAFRECLYVKLDEKCYFSSFSPSSPLLADADFRADGFKGLFNGVPDPKTLKFRARQEFWDKRLTVLNDAYADGFMIAPGLEYFQKLEHMDAASIAAARKAGRLPTTDDFLIASYEMEGDGYADLVVILVFVPENGAWKIFLLDGWD